MALTIVHEAEAPLSPLQGRTVAVLGFGNQGHAHAQNLRDSGIDVVVGQREGTRGADRAALAGFTPQPLAEAAAAGDLVILALPDEVQPDAYDAVVAPNLRPGASVGFLHGFNIHFEHIRPPAGAGTVMVAPKGPGTTLRALYLQGRGLPCLFAVDQESSAGNTEALGLAWAAGIGCARSGIVRTTFADETETDLFGEQAVICGGLTALIVAAFEVLCEAGYDPELAYLECCHEVKQVADLVYERGPAGMTEAISTTAEFGAYRAAPRLADAHLRDTLRQLLAEIRDGSFARSLREDYGQGAPWFRSRRAAAATHPIEPAGRAIRALMPWLAGAAGQAVNR